MAAALGIEAFAIRFGWLREWFPDIPQLVITFVNPGTILAALYAAVFALAGQAVPIDPGRRAGPVHLFPVRIRRLDDHRHVLPRTELGVLLVALPTGRKH